MAKHENCSDIKGVAQIANIAQNAKRHKKPVFGPAGGDSTIVESSLQIGLFMQNKADFWKSQMDVNPLLTMDYENKCDWTLGENKPNSKPISKRQAADQASLGWSLRSQPRQGRQDQCSYKHKNNNWAG